MSRKYIQEIVTKAHEEINKLTKSDEKKSINSKLITLFLDLKHYLDQTTFEEEETKNIFEPLKQRYPYCLKPDITNIRIVQSSSTVWLEVSEQIFSDSQDQTIHRIDLSYIKHIKTKELLFPPSDSIEDNARKFVESCQLYLINVAVGRYLFPQEFCRDLLIQFYQEIELSEWQLL